MRSRDGIHLTETIIIILKSKSNRKYGIDYLSEMKNNAKIDDLQSRLKTKSISDCFYAFSWMFLKFTLKISLPA